jgi:iron complex outermembrane receptor protein
MYLIGLIPFMWMGGGALPAVTDTVRMEEVVVVASPKERTAQSVEIAGKAFLDEHFTGNLMQTLERLPGIQSMPIGSGFSKPMIRGMGFNRISVTENGIKQEGQQWGADHGLEIDAFAVERILIRKGPSSLLLGSDALGGSIEILPPEPPTENRIFGEAALLAKTVNRTIGGSVMLGIKKEAWQMRLRYSEQDFGDYRVPVDTVVYLTQRLPVEHRRLKNTAGRERDWSWLSTYRKGPYSALLALSDAFQKVGFFTGAHGIPNLALLQDDGHSRNVELPYSRVNHLKISLRQQYAGDGWLAGWDAGYQNNRREEWSRFHTHYGSQPPPKTDTDKELAFTLDVFSSSIKLKLVPNERWEHTLGADAHHHQNRIGGYSFLLPRYRRLTTGGFGMSEWRPNPRLSVSGGIRYDYGRLDISPFQDPYLADYLAEQGYDQSRIEAYRWRSYPVHRSFGDFSASVGLVWKPHPAHLVKVNVGHSFRLPGANELAANGVHHGTFRHEQGDPSLHSERGWQLDASYNFSNPRLSLTLTPFASRFSNYIYLKPTGEWSVLPHAGQIYRYSEARAHQAGIETELDIRLCRRLHYCITGEYVYNYNEDEHTPLPFSPPASLRNTLTWKAQRIQVYAEMQSIAPQNRVAGNEEVTPGANLWNAGASLRFSATPQSNAEVVFSAQNLLNKVYYNHLSFYRKIEIPEPGRNFQLSVKYFF